jgi:antitoxin MazE
MAMLVSKWGDSLAVRLSAEDVARLGLKEGDEVEVKISKPGTFERDPSVTPEEWLQRMRRFRGMLPDDFKFDRDEANAR